MADIRNFMKEKEKREQKQADYQKKIRKHKLTSMYRLLLIVIVAVALIVLVAVQYKRHVYTDYDTITSVERAAVMGATDVRLGNSILTYSKDGAHCTDAKGNVSWNQTYQIQDVRTATCGNIAAIASYNGRNIYIQDTEKRINEITTNLPIRDIAVAADGTVTAVLADTDVTWVNTYPADGGRTYDGRTRMNDSGYPMSVSLSPGGELLGVAYVYVDAGVLKTNIVFYNFGPVGENNSDFIVSAFPYTNLLVPYIRFMNNRTAFAVGDNRLMIYGGDGQKPVSMADYLFDEEVQSVFYNDKYIGLVFLAEEGDKKYRMDVYNADAGRTGSYFFNTDYTDIFFGQDNFVVYNETECVIMTIDGIEKFNGNFTKTVRLMLPTNNAYRYVIVTDSSIDTIQLK
ncbi:MAG: DUF5711 family protein [Eubacterium sp.]|nr:DUF5711 family protein [Eubacterium sp.]MCM1304153.1 DUF5711 family protein [Butyrivibrio sp.]MCM1344704.1 DUF5711 family protein [Muribaculaceae bacterium]MCM1411953.1 DUF5711 family protein [Lachnospiraceae bacterium]